MAHQTAIHFRFASEKAFQAIRWMVSEVPNIDLHTLLKACYFADRSHLNKYGRPIFGATYQAMRFGPVPLEIYEMCKSEAIHLADLGKEAYPWTLRGRTLRLESNQPSAIEMEVFSQSDLEELSDGLKLSRSMTFNARTRATHGPDWQRANFGVMAYEDMIDDSVAEKASMVETLREDAAFMRL